ncbi:MAG: outer membrane protein transport protein [Gemmatimonadota bacterium]|jgi:long-chain fatty acid transport protein
MSRSTLGPATVVAGLALIASAPLAGQGSSVYTHSACASARAGAAIAAPCGDGSSVYYNPGALALQPSVIGAGLNVIINEGSFTYDEGGEVVERERAAPVVPHAYASYRFGADRRWAGSFGVWAPYGLGLEWPEEDFEGRFISWKTRLQGLYLQPTISYQVIPGKLAIGAGPQIVIGGIEINQYLDAAEQIPTLSFLPLETELAKAKLEGGGTGYGAAVGLMYVVNDRFAIGARYMHSVEVDLDGDADFTRIMNPGVVIPLPDGSLAPLDAVLDAQGVYAEGGPLDDQDVTATLTFPAQAVVGVSVDAAPGVAIIADYQWTGWSSFDQITGKFENPGADDLELPLEYEDTHSFRIGTELAASPALSVRGGFIYNTAASPDQSVTPILPEAERQLYTVGLGYDFGRFRADAYYNYVNQADRRGRVRSSLPGVFADPDLNVGVYSVSAHLIGATLSYRFGETR